MERKDFERIKTEISLFEVLERDLLKIKENKTRLETEGIKGVCVDFSDGSSIGIKIERVELLKYLNYNISVYEGRLEEKRKFLKNI